MNDREQFEKAREKAAGTLARLGLLIIAAKEVVNSRRALVGRSMPIAELQAAGQRHARSIEVLATILEELEL